MSRFPRASRSALVAWLALALLAALASDLHASEPASAESEVSHLLDFVDQSGCDFFRNGSWYDSKRASAHLRFKYQALVAASRPVTAEEFILKAATASGLTGQAYAVRCPGELVEPCNAWLSTELTRYRAGSAPRRLRGALR